MLWQLWVPVAVCLAVLAIVGAVKLHHASQVFDRIVGQIDENRADEVAQLRRAREAALRAPLPGGPAVVGQPRHRGHHSRSS